MSMFSSFNSNYGNGFLILQRLNTSYFSLHSIVNVYKSANKMQQKRLTCVFS